MPVTRDYDDIADILILVQEAQDAEQGQRARVKEAKLFITAKDGQWDTDSTTKMQGRFRGTFDMCTPIVDGIAGEIDKSDFTLRISPSGGTASKDTAKTLDGLVRNIRNVSNAEDIFNKAARSCVVGGFDAWEVVQDWADGNSFDQDILIKKIPNASDSVWFDLASVEQDRSDSSWGVKLVAIPIADYRAKWPKGTETSVGDNARVRSGQDRKEVVTVGQLYYKKPIKIELVRMTDGSVYEDNESFKQVQTELKAKGIEIEKDDKGEEKRRTRDSWRVWARKFDGAAWLEEEEKTVFDFIPLIPIYGNFDIIDNQCVYFGKLQNLYDSQRVLNYALSRDIEDGALSPAETTWMTDKQAEGNNYSQMNVDHVPVRIYNVDEKAPPPFKTPGPQASGGLQTTIANVQEMIGVSSNTFQAQQGNASSTQSGVAGLQQIEQANIGSIKWFKSLEIAICQTGKVILSAVPRVYDGTRQVQILGEDGSSSTVVLNQPTFDEETKENVTLNDLSKGEYDVVCDVGPAFNSAQKEAARSFEVIAGIDPSLAQRGMDIWLKNKKEPGMDLMAERVREDLFKAGLIPESQLTDEEKALIQQAQEQQAQNPPPPDPLMVAAQAEMGKAQADQLNAENKTLEIQGNQQLKGLELSIKDKEIDLKTQMFIRAGDDKFNTDAAKIDQGQQSIDQKMQQMLINADQEQRKLDQAEQQQQFNEMVTIVKGQQEQFSQAITDLKGLREASGIETIVGVGNLENIEAQTQKVNSMLRFDAFKGEFVDAS